MKNYEINSDTLAIIPLSSSVSKVIEFENTLEINNSTKNIIDNSCRYFGSSYKGRFEGTKNILGVNYKAPIIIEETKPLIFFPTSSPRFDECIWLCLNNIENYYRNNNKSSYIKFKNGDKLLLDISYASLDSQILRASRLDLLLRNRKIVQ